MESNIKGKIILLILLTILCLVMKMTSVLGGDLGRVKPGTNVSGIHVKLELPLRQ